MTELNKQQETKKSWIRNSLTLKMGVIGILILILLIPLSFIKDLIKERKQLQNEVIADINKGWGEESQLYGPILKIPYKVYSKSSITDEKTGETKIIKDESTYYAYFFPDELNVDGEIITEPKHKGIYTTSVFTAKTKIMGNFGVPDFKSLEIPEENIVWEKAQIVMQTSNLKGIKDALQINLNGKNYHFESQFSNDTKPKPYYYDEGKYRVLSKHTIITKSFDFNELYKEKPISFSVNYNVSGSKRFEIIPIGKETKMHLISNWKNSGFEGEYLPYNPDKIKPDGFDASWKVLQMNRPFSQQFNYLPDLQEYAFGVNFIIPVDNYKQNERSAKYGYLMIALTFLLFFLIQTMSKINIHPFQYLMIGLALVIFYTLLISISEHSNFATAYLIAGSGVIVLITLYSKSILKNWKFPVFIGSSLTALYGFIFVIIQLENYALLVGSIGLFVILAAVMYSSRKIDWN
jgi:inner membrane protein